MANYALKNIFDFGHVCTSINSEFAVSGTKVLNCIEKETFLLISCFLDFPLQLN